jgi:hypothetical protein
MEIVSRDSDGRVYRFPGVPLGEIKKEVEVPGVLWLAGAVRLYKCTREREGMFAVSTNAGPRGQLSRHRCELIFFKSREDLLEVLGGMPPGDTPGDRMMFGAMREVLGFLGDAN